MRPGGGLHLTGRPGRGETPDVPRPLSRLPVVGRLLVAACLLAGRAGHAQDSTAMEVLAGELGGVVRDERGAPIAGADVLVLGTARRTRTNAEGVFALTGLVPGIVDVRIRRLGFVATDGEALIAEGKRTNLQVTLRRLAAVLDTVAIRAQVFNELSGTVVDSLGRPMADVDVALTGVERTTVTGPDGRFVFTDIPPGTWMLRARRASHQRQVFSVRMAEKMERDIRITLRGLRDGLSDELSRIASGAGWQDSIAWADQGRRRAWLDGSAGATGATVVSAEELQGMRGIPLDLALRERAPLASQRMGLAPGPRGPTSLGGARPASSDAAPACVLEDGIFPNDDRPLATWQADQVESLELWPPGSEDTRTICIRFLARSPCGCNRSVPYYIIWFKR